MVHITPDAVSYSATEDRNEFAEIVPGVKGFSWSQIEQVAGWQHAQ